LPEHMGSDDLVHDAASAGIFIAPADNFATTRGAAPAMRVNVAYGADPAFLGWLREQLARG